MTKEKFIEYLTSQTVKGEAITKVDAENFWNTYENFGCLFCGKDRKYMGIMLPTNSFSSAIGGREGMMRQVFYALCEDHMPNETTAERAEKIIRYQLNPLTNGNIENNTELQ